MIWLQRDLQDKYMLGLYYEHKSPKAEKSETVMATCIHVDYVATLLGIKFSEVDEAFEKTRRVELEIRIKKEEERA